MGFKLKNVNKMFGCGRISGEGLCCCLIMGGVMTARLIMESCCVG